MKFDDASWHYGGNYPKGLPTENASTHIGMFLKWCVCRNLYSEFLAEESTEEVKSVRDGKMTGAQLLIHWDEKFVDDMLSETGNLFALDYYESKTKFAKKYDSYTNDYCYIFDKKADENGFEYESLYHVEDTKENYDLMAAKIDERFQQWVKFKKIKL